MFAVPCFQNSQWNLYKGQAGTRLYSTSLQRQVTEFQKTINIRDPNLSKQMSGLNIKSCRGKYGGLKIEKLCLQFCLKCSAVVWSGMSKNIKRIADGCPFFFLLPFWPKIQRISQIYEGKIFSEDYFKKNCIRDKWPVMSNDTYDIKLRHSRSTCVAQTHMSQCQTHFTHPIRISKNVNPGKGGGVP